MLATRQVLGNVSRGRVAGGAAFSGIRRMATVSDSPLDRKVCLNSGSSRIHAGTDASRLSWWAAMNAR